MANSSGRKRRSSKHNKDVSAENRAKQRKAKILGVSTAMTGAAIFATVSTFGLFASAGEGNANDCQLIGNCVVPEISALEGTAALAVVAAALLLAWERRRQA